MTPAQKRTFFILLAVGAIYFILFIPPNHTGAKDQMMISLFEPDEFAQYPIAAKMVAPEDSLKQALINFFIYGHYYYGWLFYASSALLVLVGNSVQQDMLLLRQFIGVLPMLGALLLLVYIQTQFRSRLKAIGLFLFLLAVSAVVENNLWWHADSLAIFFVALAIFFLDKDELRFGPDFYLAAASTGLAAGTKVIGLFFFLAIPAYILLGILQKKVSWKTAAFRALAFAGIMAAAIFLSNPFLVYKSQRADMIEILSRQSALQNQGWVLSYAKGPASWMRIIESLYGRLPFIALAFFALAFGLSRAESRARSLVIGLWAIPFGLYVLFAVAIKPTHFFLPILLPVYSGLVGLFDFPVFEKKNVRSCLLGGLFLSVIGWQFILYIAKDIELYREVLTREEHQASLVFYRELEADIFSRLQTDEKLVVVRDVRMYLPDDSRWVVRSYWNIKYSVVEQIEPDLILLWSQRIWDYIQQGARENAVNQADFDDIYEFYVDANKDQLPGYRLVQRDAEGLLFIREELYQEYFR